jgi:acetyl coenzyme A synthetase (ADP forming)-like protein
VATSAATIPEGQSVDVALRGGSTVHIRPLTPDDRDAIRAFLERLSSDSIAFRFMGIPNLDWVVDWSLDVDYADRYGLVATAGPDHAIVAHAAYLRGPGDSAEVAFIVSDELHGQGIATIMLGHLAGAAQEHGITVFTAEVLPANHRMIEVFRESGFPTELRARDGVIGLEFPTALSDDALDAFERREQSAAIAALRSFLVPRSVAVIGASCRKGSVGAEIFRHLIAAEFSGVLYPVNPRGGAIQGHKAYPSIRDVPESVELAVVVVPAAQVPEVARECGEAGVKGLVVISAGFAETGAEGAALQRELLEACRDHGMRMVGPNCLGVINTDPEVRLDATFASHAPPSGSIGFMSQSGGLGIALIEAAGRLDLGLSTFVSVGNKGDISGNDLLEYWENDPATSVILMYLESFGNPRRFARVARRISRAKPILAVKSGRTRAGARATSSHTGALISASDVTVDALFRQAGVIRTDTIGELLSTASLLSAQPAPRGGRVAIVTNGGGPGIVAADACQAAGLDVVELRVEIRATLANFLPRGASVANPIDMIATATPEQYRRTIETLIETDACDAIIALFVPPLNVQAADVAREIHAVAQGADGVTLCAVFMDRDAPQYEAAGGAIRVPRFEFPEDAVRALVHAVHYAQWQARPAGMLAIPEASRPTEAAAIIAQALSAGEGWLSPADVHALLDCYGLPLLPTRVVATPDEAARAATELNGPVALKAYAPGLVHKTDAGGVRLGVEGGEAVRSAALEIERMVAAHGHRLRGLVVQPMAPPGGVELLLGVVSDENFGPVIACGAGGTSAELLGDVAVRITPLSDLDAAEMVRSLRTFPLLSGYRGSPPCDVDAVEDALRRLSALVETHPEIAEMDLNPLLATPNGAAILDARVRVQAPPPRRPLAALRS